MRDLRIAVVPGDGIGVDVTAEAVKVLQAVSDGSGAKVEMTPYDWGADRYLKTRLIHLPWLEPDEQRRDVNSAWEDRPERGPHSRTR